MAPRNLPRGSRTWESHPGVAEASHLGLLRDGTELTGEQLQLRGDLSLLNAHEQSNPNVIPFDRRAQ